MQVELSLVDLQHLLMWADESNAHAGRDEQYDDLVERLEQALLDVEELQALDLNDCGDACKL